MSNHYLNLLGENVERPKEPSVETHFQDLADIFSALGDITRLRILSVLAERECCVCELAQTLGLSPSNCSHQLRILRGLRLVRSRREGKHVFYAADDEHVRHLVEQGLAHVREAR